MATKCSEQLIEAKAVQLKKKINIAANNIKNIGGARVKEYQTNIQTQCRTMYILRLGI
jgi:hypothetical protein